MVDREMLFQVAENCDIYFDDCLISKELIVKEYTNFLATSVTSRECSPSIALHTGSVCFNIVSLIMATLACIFMDQASPEDVIAGLNVGDMVLYKNKRCRWLGKEERSGKLCLKLENDETGITLVPAEEYMGKIQPYYGNSKVTDGRGIKRQKSKRSEFIGFVLGKKEADIPSIIGISVVIIADRAVFERIYKGLRIEYGHDKTICLSEIVPASYYADVDKPQQLGKNPSKAEPVLKVTGKVSTARNLILNDHGKGVVGLLVLEADAASKGSSELADLLPRKKLDFIHLSMSIDSKIAEEYIIDEIPSVFACTKELLLRYRGQAKVYNQYSAELEKQIDFIINKKITTVNIDGGCLRETYKTINDALTVIRQSEWDAEYKNRFIILSYGLLKLFVRAVFSMETMEQAVIAGDLQHGVASPRERLEEIWKLAEKENPLENCFICVADALNDLYNSIYLESPKCQVLKQIVQSVPEGSIAIVVPNAYYEKILIKESLYSRNGIYIVSPNKFDANKNYEKIIVIGAFTGKRFDAVQCNSSSDITVLLYDCEIQLFAYIKNLREKFERQLNKRNNLEPEFSDIDTDDSVFTQNVDKQYIQESLDLEKFIENVRIPELRKYITSISGDTGNTPTAEISAVGTFVTGESIMFSRYYKAIVYNPSQVENPITEADAEKLSAGDKLVFAKRDDFTKNFVDLIYDSLLRSGKLSKDITDATDKTKWWKSVLQKYQLMHELTYKGLARKLNQFGCSLSETSIRQWLDKESHIVGPRDESTLRQIAEMTQDSKLLNDTSGYFNACRLVRSQRKKILKLIGQAVADKLSGHQPEPGSDLELVYNNVENLSETLELDAITFLDNFWTVPVNVINKPIILYDVENLL